MFNGHYHGTSLASPRTLFNVVQYYAVELVNVNFFKMHAIYYLLSNNSPI